MDRHFAFTTYCGFWARETFSNELKVGDICYWARHKYKMSQCIMQLINYERGTVTSVYRTYIDI